MDGITLVVGIVTLIFLLLLVGIVIALFLQLRKLQSNQGNNPELAPQIAVLGEKLSHIEPIIQSVNSVQTDLRGLTERISSVEQNQTVANQGVNSVQNDLRGISERMNSVEQNQYIVNQGVGNFATDALSRITELKTLTTNLSEATGVIRTELADTKNDLTALHTHVKAEQESERKMADSIHRLETIIAGTQTKGSAGENVLEVVFAKLPIEWQLRDFRIGGKAVEFALRLPNNLINPMCKFFSTL